MSPPNDLMLLVEEDGESLSALRAVTEELGCDRIEADSAEDLGLILTMRRPTIAVLALDTPAADGLAILRTLADNGARPAVFLIGSVDARVLTSARRAAAARGLTVIGASSRPVDIKSLCRVLAKHVSAPPPVSKPEVERALAEHELSLQYQPKISLRGGPPRVVGAEALVRWQHPRRGTLQPHHFLQAFESHGCMAAMTDFVMVEAARQAGLWRTQGVPLEMIVNLSPRLIHDAGFPERLGCVLREYEVPAGQVVLDVTEASGTEDRAFMLDVFTRLRILGVGLALDNFGTGLSSLTDVYRLPFSEIKLDSSLVSEVTCERDAQVIVRAMASLAHSLELSICAEGVETREVLDFVLEANFDSAQGHLFCGPVSAAEIERVVSAWPGSALASTGTWRAPTIANAEDSSNMTQQVRVVHLPSRSRS